jgi:hypothetical protein
LPDEERHEAGMQIVSWPYFLKYAYMRLHATTPGSSAGLKDCGPPLAFTHSSTAATDTQQQE